MQWPAWIGCLLRRILLDLRRATGIAYQRYEPLVGTEVDPKEIDKMVIKSDQMVESVEHLERELRRLGIRTR